MLTVEKRIISRNFTRAGAGRKIEYIVIHYFGYRIYLFSANKFVFKRSRRSLAFNNIRHYFNAFIESGEYILQIVPISYGFN